MLRIVHGEDPVRALEAAYLEARESRSAKTDSLRAALKLARLKLHPSARVYDLKRRVAKALERFKAMKGQRVATRGARKVVPMSIPNVVQMFPDSAPRMSA